MCVCVCACACVCVCVCVGVCMHVHVCVCVCVCVKQLRAKVEHLVSVSECQRSVCMCQKLNQMLGVHASGPYITFSMWGGNVINCCPAVVHSRVVWGHAPPGNLGVLRRILRHKKEDTELVKKKLIIITIIACCATGTLKTISIG